MMLGLQDRIAARVAKHALNEHTLTEHERRRHVATLWRLDRGFHTEYAATLSAMQDPEIGSTEFLALAIWVRKRTLPDDELGLARLTAIQRKRLARRASEVTA